MLKVKIKKLHPDAVIPKYSKKGDAGLDFTAIERILSDKDDSKADYIEYKTGISIEIPKGYVGLLFPRSSNCNKDLTLCNHVGVIDSNYRGEISFRYKVDATYDSIELKDKHANVSLHNDYFFQCIYEPFDRVGQMIIIPYPEIEFEEVTKLSKTNRNNKGFGSSGK